MLLSVNLAAFTTSCQMLTYGKPGAGGLVNEPNPESDPNYAAGKSQIDHTRIYDCSTKQLSNPGLPDDDLFCCGHSFQSDGTLLIAGGTEHFPDNTEGDLHHPHWSGSRKSWIFDPRANPTWIKGPLLNRDPEQTEAGQPMGGGRWYPTLITLSSGDYFCAVQIHVDRCIRN